MDMSDTQDMHFDTQARGSRIVPTSWLLGLLAGSLLIVIAMMGWADLSMDFLKASNAKYLLALTLLASIRYAMRDQASGRPRIARDFAEYVGFFLFISLLGATATYPAAAATSGFADAALARIDAALGFEWMDWYRLVVANPWLQTAGSLAYANIYMSPVLLLGGLAISGERARAQLFLFSFWLAAVITMLLFLAMPAVGPLAYVPLLAVPVVLVIALLAQLPLARSAEQAQRLATKRHVVLVETLLGIETVKSLNAEPVMQREWESAVAASSRIGGRTRTWSSLATSATQFVQQAVSVVIIFWGVFLVSEQRITIGALIAANILSGRILAPLAAVAQTIFRTHYARRSMQVLDEMMELPREGGAQARSGLRIERGDLALREVSFRYPGAEHPAVAGLTLDIAAGETVALLGRVGSGKTTTGKLLNGLLAPDSGTILIDGHGIGQYEPAELREGVGYLTQEIELFTGSLRENMVLGRPEASDEEIRKALWLAGMDGFVAASPAGLNLFVGERGNRLSGGQRQGVALARLLLRGPKVLFLDEPTNSMDLQMESAVIARLREVGQGRTTLILCTHRMSLADVADRFVVLDRGRKVLDGPKADVLAQLRAARMPEVEG